MALQLRRGLKANLPATAAPGEPLIATDTRELYVGNATGTGLLKISDVVFGAVQPPVELEKIWINTATNAIYRADTGAWVKCGAVEIATAADLGAVAASNDNIPSQLAVKTYVDNAITNVDLTGVIPKTDIATAVDLGGETPSDVKVPSQAAVKTAITTAIDAIDTSVFLEKTAIDVAVDLGGVAASDIKVPSQLATKTAIDTAVGAVDLTAVLSIDDALGGIAPVDNKAPSQAAVKTYVDLAVAGIVIPNEWPNSVKDQVTVDPPVPVAGDRYLVSGPATGAFAGMENQLAEYTGVVWEFTAPVTGSFLSVDADTTGLYYYGGSNWVKKSFEATTVAPGLTQTAGQIGINPTIAGTGLVWDPILGVLSVGVIDGGTF